MRARWLTGRAVGFHCLVVVITSVCLLAARWQLHAALGGNGLSWAYTFEWPIFAAIAVVAWWHLIHEDPAARAARTVRAETPEWDEPSSIDEAAVAAAARREYEAHLARLAVADEAGSQPQRMR